MEKPKPYHVRLEEERKPVNIVPEEDDDDIFSAHGSRKSTPLFGFRQVTPPIEKKRPSWVKAKEKKKYPFPSLVEQMEVVTEWWKQIDNNKGNFQIPIQQVAKFFVAKKISPDTEKAKAIIYKAQLNRDKRPVVSYDEFNRIFCKGIFRSALQHVTNQINSHENADLELQSKIHQYERKLKLAGMDKKHDNHRHGHITLKNLSLYKQKMTDLPGGLSEEECERLMKDPFGEIQERVDEEEKQRNEENYI